MRSVGGDVCEERRLVILLCLYPTKCCGEKQISAKALGFHKRSVVANDRVKILVARRIGAAALVGLANSTGTMDERLIKPTRVRLVGFFITQMPFAEDTAGVAGLLKYLREDRCLKGHAFAFKDGVRHAVFHRVPTGHDGTTRGRTRRTYKKPCEARAGVIKLIEIRRANPWMAVPTNGAVALIIGDNQNDIRLLSVNG